MTILDLYDDATFEAVRDQLVDAADHELYADYFEEAGVDPASIESWDDFRSLPFTSVEELLSDVEEHPPEGSLFEDGSMISFTPAKEGELPVYETPGDIERYEEIHETIYDRIGLKPGMRGIMTHSYHHFGTGYITHRQLEAFGIEVYPAGPGHAERTANIIQEFDIDIFVGNPSFALKVADHGADAVDFVIGGGEPFTSIPGQREAVHEAFDSLESAVDNFGLRQATPIAIECAAEDGLHVVDESVIVEIVDPDSGKVLGAGERGEVVLTHVEKEAMPLVRYRTGDLSVLKGGDCPHCDATVTMPKGVFGRTDERLKVKGVKVYPEGVFLVLVGFPDLTGNHQIRVSRPHNTDKLTVVVEGAADEEDLREKLTEQLQLTPDEIQFVDELGNVPTVVDERH